MLGTRAIGRLVVVCEPSRSARFVHNAAASKSGSTAPQFPGVGRDTMSAEVALHSVSVAWIGCMALVLAGAAVQVAVGAGLSVICGPFLLLWFGTAVGVPTLLCLNLLVSVVATL